jgi:hypothetical protein
MKRHLSTPANESLEFDCRPSTSFSGLTTLVLLVLSLTNATAQPESWVSLNTWYSPSRGDHSTTTEPGWQGSVGETRSPDYRFVRREGYALTPVETQRPDTVGLYGWYDSQRGDNWTTSQWPGTPGSMLSPN